MPNQAVRFFEACDDTKKGWSRILTWTRIQGMQFFVLAVAICLSQPACEASNAGFRNGPANLPNQVSNEQVEKISDLPKRLSTEGAPSGSDPSVGDIAFYAPWGNLAIFYRDAEYANGLIILGKIDGDAAAFNVLGSLKVTIESVK